MTRKLLGVLFLMMFTTPVFAIQGRGGRGGGAPAGAAIPSNPGAQGNRPSTPGIAPDQRPANPGKPDSAGIAAADHKPDASSHAVDPKDTHGFKNYGEYVAANHVSENLGIPLGDLKTAMNADGGNLGKAIHTLRPGLSSKQVDAEIKKAKAAARKAEAEARKARG